MAALVCLDIHTNKHTTTRNVGDSIFTALDAGESRNNSYVSDSMDHAHHAIKLTSILPGSVNLVWGGWYFILQLIPDKKNRLQGKLSL